MRHLLRPACFLTALLLAAAFFSGLPVSGASAEWHNACGEDLLWFMDEKGVLTITGTGDMYSYIEDRPGWRRSDVRKVIIEPGVTSIGALAFEQCKYLESVEIPDTVTRIGDYAFDGCMALKSVALPDSLREIGINPFCQCRKLEEVTLSADNPAFTLQDGMLLSREDCRLVFRCAGYDSGACSIPEGTRIIGSSAFAGCDELVSVNIPEGVTEIGSSAFSGCDSLVFLDLPDSVVSAGNYAFSGCYTLLRITLPEGMTSIGTGAFLRCRRLETLSFPLSLSFLGNCPLGSCESLKEIGLDTNHPYLGFKDGMLYTKGEGKLLWYAAEYPSTVCTIPDGIRIIGEEAFQNGQKLEEIIIPGSVTTIEKRAFAGCGKVTEITFSQGLETIGKEAFADMTALEDAVLPEGLKSIGDYAFGGCYSLKTVLIPQSVTEIGDDLFVSIDKINLAIYAEKGSAAEQYCLDNSLKTVPPGQEVPEPEAPLPDAFTAAYPGYTGLYRTQTGNESEAVFLARRPDDSLVLLCGARQDDGSWSIVESAPLPAGSRLILYDGMDLIDTGKAFCSVCRYHDDLWGIFCVGWKSFFFGPGWIGDIAAPSLYFIDHPWDDLTTIDWNSLDEGWDRLMKPLDRSSWVCPNQADRQARTPLYAAPDTGSERIVDLVHCAPLFVVEKGDEWTHVRLGRTDERHWALDGWVRTEDLSFDDEKGKDRFDTLEYGLFAKKGAVITLVTPLDSEQIPEAEYNSDRWITIGEKTDGGQDYWLVYEYYLEKPAFIPKDVLAEPNG